MYVSDYGYATDLRKCRAVLTSYSDNECYNNNWLGDSSNNQYTISPRNYTNYASYIFYINNSKVVASGSASSGYTVRPVVNLKWDVFITGGNGSEEYPYVLSISE